ncbi:hypothetical protein F4778DRAFT_251411 [Xylariomycetidae sp. FL2044]|nr:hypothetical protein F4778DRAFT_251411 [Xylariomycetidae sp. FL2044]
MYMKYLPPLSRRLFMLLSLPIRLVIPSTKERRGKAPKIPCSPLVHTPMSTRRQVPGMLTSAMSQAAGAGWRGDQGPFRVRITSASRRTDLVRSGPRLSNAIIRACNTHQQHARKPGKSLTPLDRLSRLHATLSWYRSYVSILVVPQIHYVHNKYVKEETYLHIPPTASSP